MADAPHADRMMVLAASFVIPIFAFTAERLAALAGLAAELEEHGCEVVVVHPGDVVPSPVEGPIRTVQIDESR